MIPATSWHRRPHQWRNLVTDTSVALRAAIRRLIAAIGQNEVEVRVLRHDLEVLLAVNALRGVPRVVGPVLHPEQR